MRWLFAPSARSRVLGVKYAVARDWVSGHRGEDSAGDLFPTTTQEAIRLPLGQRLESASYWLTSG